MGRYVLNSSIFSVLKTIGRGAGNEIQLTDALREVCRKEPIHAGCWKEIDMTLAISWAVLKRAPKSA